jgi:hypothetical protein
MIHLRKLLKLMYLAPNRRVSALRADIRDDIARESGDPGSGGDFYGPFWSDAKAHVFGSAYLPEMVQVRIAANSGRANLYPQLRDGFLLWWNERRRWTNEPFRQTDAIKTVHPIEEFDAYVKVANIMCVRDARDEDHYVYPYWFPDPALADESGRVGLWLLRNALGTVDPRELRLLDVIRGQTFSLDRTPLAGNEEERFQTRYRTLLAEWDALRTEYD